MEKTQLPALRINSDAALADNAQWQNRFEIESESSNRVYVVSQHKEKKHWGCSCPAWRTRRRCKHLTEIGLPPNEIPYEPTVLKQ